MSKPCPLTRGSAKREARRRLRETVEAKLVAVPMFPPEPPDEPETTLVKLDDLPRDLNGPEPSHALVESIKRFGVLVPIVISHNGKGTIRVLDGIRRVKGARKANNRDEIRAEVRKFGSSTVDAAVTLCTNTIRSSNPVTETEMLLKLMQAGASEKEITQATGMVAPMIRRRLRLHNLAPVLWDAFRGGKLHVGVAEAASRLSRERQEALVERFEEAEKLTLGDVKAVRQVVHADAVAALPASLFEEEALAPAEAVSERLRLLERIVVLSGLAPRGASVGDLRAAVAALEQDTAAGEEESDGLE